ncbi:unnamed protein product [Peronospora belbahrii]|uniref:SCP domain-containing protein n=1 Tax=Peronospora belbahrii TaxID=622444 RepID=A0AAU9L940_9STRA|nr:unnamed protein product [Peronospora belbahrii]
MAIVQSSLTLVLVVAAASSGCSKAANLRQRNLSGYTDVNTYTAYEEYASAMLMAVNKQRATKGLSPLCLNKKLHNAAMGHSLDMAAHDYMDHEGSDGSRLSQRITQAGYDWEAVAENVAAGQVDVDEVMEGWIKSPGHLENIMGDYTMFGSAYAFNKDGTYQHYWTQNFGSGDAEECDGSPTSSLTPSPQYTTKNVDQMQSEAETVETPATATVTETAVTPATATVTETAVTPATATETAVAPAPVITVAANDAPATDAPATKASVTDALADSTSAIDSPKGKDCKSHF